MKKRDRTRARSNRGPGKRDAGIGAAARAGRESFIGFPGSSPFTIALFCELVEAGGRRDGILAAPFSPRSASVSIRGWFGRAPKR